jgi:hypothetical protein
MQLGHAQSGAWFEAKTRFLRPLFDQALRDSSQPGSEQLFPEGIELIYATGCHQLEPSNLAGGIAESEDSPMAADFDAWAWGRGDYAKDEIEGFEESIRNLIQLLHDEGPFIGIVGFSTGATTALTLVSIAERGATNDIQEAFRLEPSVSSSINHNLLVSKTDCLEGNELTTVADFPPSVSICDFLLWLYIVASSIQASLLSKNQYTSFALYRGV